MGREVYSRYLDDILGSLEIVAIGEKEEDISRIFGGGTWRRNVGLREERFGNF